MKKFRQNCTESHMWEQLKEVGCSYLSSFISMHSFTTFKTSLMKRFNVPDSGSGAGGQNCSVAPDPESGAGLNKLKYMVAVIKQLFSTLMKFTSNTTHLSVNCATEERWCSLLTHFLA